MGVDEYGGVALVLGAVPNQFRSLWRLALIPVAIAVIALSCSVPVITGVFVAIITLSLMLRPNFWII